MSKGLMKIYINGRFLTQFVTGAQRYAREMVKSMDELIDSASNLYDIQLLVPSRGIDHSFILKNINIKSVGLLTGHLWEQIELPFYSRDGLLLSLCNPAPVFKSDQIAVIHDMIVYAVPETTSFLFRNWHKTIC